MRNGVAERRQLPVGSLQVVVGLLEIRGTLPDTLLKFTVEFEDLSFRSLAFIDHVLAVADEGHQPDGDGQTVRYLMPFVQGQQRTRYIFLVEQVGVHEGFHHPEECYQDEPYG